MESYDRPRTYKPRLRALVRPDTREAIESHGQPDYQVDGDPRTSGPGSAITQHPSTLDIPRHWTMPRLIFVNSMSDLSGGVGVTRKAISAVSDGYSRAPQFSRMAVCADPSLLNGWTA